MKNELRVLLVDDEMTIRNGLKNLLPWQEEGFTIVGEANNGKKAIQLIQQTQPHIVITDLMMPEMNGLELAEVIHQQFPAIQFLVLSSYDDFEYVSGTFKQGAADYLLKPQLQPETLLAALKKIAAKFSLATEEIDIHTKLSQQLSRFLSGYEQALDDEALQQTLHNPTYCFLYTKNHFFNQQQQLSTFLEKTHSLADEAIIVLPFSTSQNESGWLLSFDSISTAELHTRLQKELHPLLTVEPDAFFVISSCFSDLTLLQQQFHDLQVKAKNQRFFFKGQGIVHEQELLQLENTREFDAHQYLFSLVNHDYLLSIERLESYFNQLILQHVTPIVLKQQATSIFYTFLSMLEKNSSLQPQLLQWKPQVLNELNGALYLEDFSSTVLSTIEKLKLLVTESEPQSDDQVLNDLIYYIQQHYHENLNLKKLAEKFHFSYNYLSTYFSTNFHMNFSEYLNTLRVKKAKDLLVHSAMNLSEISYAVGYSDVSYFSRVFKKETGLTPSSYRRGNR